MLLSADLRATLEGVSTATITTILLKKGIRRTWMKGPKPLAAGPTRRMVGPAFTLRFIPAREDVATPASWSAPKSTRSAIEEMPENVMVIVDAMGIVDSGIFGDILVERMKRRGVSGLVTDGAVRDAVGCLNTGLPIWCAGVAAPPSVSAITYVGHSEPIGCGGVAVFPNDIVVADGDGAVVIPADLVEEVAAAGPEQERLEAWIVGEVEKGLALPGLYPANDHHKARYEAWKAGKG
jgi:regulator of RNase E activity RraA